MYTCIAVDDERPALKLLAAYLQKVPHIQLQNTYESGTEALKNLVSEPVDILFLDIQMPGLTGLELLKTLSHKPQVILTTAYREYAVEGFVLSVTDYLVKPFSFERFLQSCNKAVEQLALKQSPPTSPMAQAVEAGTEDYFFVKRKHQSERVDFHSILYIEGMREYVAIITPKRKYVVHYSMKAMMERLPSHLFMRIHRSYIVPIDKIKAINGNTVCIEEQSLPVSSSYREAFFKRINRL